MSKTMSRIRIRRALNAPVRAAAREFAAFNLRIRR
jgi:hypothetical protein